MQRIVILVVSLILGALSSFGQNQGGNVIRDVIYTSHEDEYSQQQCRLDIYIPDKEKDFVTIIWFHGGGLTGGDRSIPSELKGKGVRVVSVGYRFSPHTSIENIIADAADAVQWTHQNIEKYGGNANRLVVSGYSAGAYLALMVGLNRDYLAKREVEESNMLGIVAVSGQTITHFAARNVMGIPETQPLVDHLAPLYWVRKDAPPIMLITGDRELEMLGRYEENAYLKRMLNIVGHPSTTLHEIDGYDHGVTLPAFPLLIKQVKNWSTLR